MLGQTVFLTLASLATLAPSPVAASAVNMAICDAKQKWYQITGKTQGFCDIGASGGRNQFLYATSGPITVPSLQSGQHAEYIQFGPDVTCRIDPESEKISASYWGGSHEQDWTQCTGAMSGEPAQNFCRAHGFEDPADTSFLVQCPGFPMEPN